MTRNSLPSVINRPNNSLPMFEAQNKGTPILILNGETGKAESSHVTCVNIPNGHQQLRVVDTPLTTPITETSSSAEDRIAVSNALVDKLASLIGIEPKEIKPTVQLSDLGLDSFLASEFQSWINSTFSVSTEISDILDSLNLSDLASLVTQKSSKLKQGPQTPRENGSKLNLSSAHKAAPKKKEDPASKKLPSLPLPRLESTLNTYLSSIEAIATPSELANTERIVADFLKVDSLGRKLHARLKRREDDSDIDCWLIDLYNESNFLDRNTALAPFGSFFYTHNISKSPHRQAERAALITVAARKWIASYKAGEVKPEQLNGQDTCMYSFQWLFNTHRKPRVGRDEMERFEDEDYIVVLRLGRVFKVAIKNGQVDIPYSELEAEFEAILEKKGDASWAGILTADSRNSWAKVREVVKGASNENAEYLRVIERASFLVCLDDASPTTPAERAYHYHFGDGSNRWWDKGMQFAVCSNGVSGQLVEHAMLDASSVYPLNVFMSKEIMAHKPDTSRINTAEIKLKEYPFTTTQEIDTHIERVRKEYQESCAGYEHRFFDYNTFGASLAREKKIPPKSTFQMAVALASRTHFGYNPAFWEGISLGSFYRGRVEINQVTLPSVISFTTATLDPATPIATRRTLLFNAAKIHANTVTRAVRGRGFDRHMTSLRQMIREDEEVPELFSDEVYQRSRPRKIMSHCHDTAMAEKGFGLRDPDAIWVHFEVEDETVRFSITGRNGKAEAFEGELKKALETIRHLLVSE